MHDLLPTLLDWTEGEEPFALAVVARVTGSSPRATGALLAIAQDGGRIGSISAGCVESKVTEIGQEVIETQKPQVVSFGKADDLDPWSVGLSCGGTIEVLIAPVQAGEPAFLEWLNKCQDFRPATCWIPKTTNGAITCATPESSDTHFPVEFAPPPRLLIVGGGHISGHLCALARQTGWYVEVIDPRDSFTQPGHFPIEAHEVHRAWPDKMLENNSLGDDVFAVLLTHDPKIDDPALTHLLKSQVAYIGALGSHTTQEKRRRRLSKQGFSAEQISRIHGPIGIDIGAISPEEIAVSILAEMLLTKNGGQKWKK